MIVVVGETGSGKTTQLTQVAPLLCYFREYTVMRKNKSLNL